MRVRIPTTAVMVLFAATTTCGSDSGNVVTPRESAVRRLESGGQKHLDAVSHDIEAISADARVSRVARTLLQSHVKEASTFEADIPIPDALAADSWRKALDVNAVAAQRCISAADTQDSGQQAHLMSQSLVDFSTASEYTAQALERINLMLSKGSENSTSNNN
jgi:hypothetical protein